MSEQWFLALPYRSKSGAAMVDIRAKTIGDTAMGSRFVCEATPEDAEHIVNLHNAALAARATDRAELEALREELAETRAHEHVLVIVGDMLARHLEWIAEEPTLGFDAELLDAIKARAKPDTEQWAAAIKNAGFKRPDAALAAQDRPAAAPAERREEP